MPANEGELARVFRGLCAENPNADPVEMARLAGFKHPETAAKRIKTMDERAAVRAAEEEDNKKHGIEPDRTKALRTLRQMARSGTPGARVAAAKALIEATPAPISKDRVLVVFRGRSTDEHQQLASNIDPQVLAAAIEAATQEREAQHQEQIRDFAQRFTLDPDELSLAWELWSHTEARAAGLRVLMLSDSRPTPLVPISQGVIISTPIPIPTDQGEQSVALESGVPTSSIDSGA